MVSRMSKRITQVAVETEEVLIVRRSELAPAAGVQTTAWSDFDRRRVDDHEEYIARLQTEVSALRELVVRYTHGRAPTK